MNKKSIRIDNQVITLLKVEWNLFGKMCHIAEKDRFEYERGGKI